MTTKITLTSVKCNKTSSGSGNDEVYIIYQSDAGIPRRHPRRLHGSQRMNTSSDPSNNVVSEWQVNIPMEFERDVLVTLYDHDNVLDAIQMASDYLVSYDYTPNNLPSQVVLSNNDGAQYTLNITVQS